MSRIIVYGNSIDRLEYIAFAILAVAMCLISAFSFMFAIAMDAVARFSQYLVNDDIMRDNLKAFFFTLAMFSMTAFFICMFAIGLSIYGLARKCIS